MSTLARIVAEAQKTVDTFASPIDEVIRDSPVTKLGLHAAELMAARQQELDKMMAPLKKLQLDPAIFNVPMAGLPPRSNPNFPPLPKPLMVELNEPLRVELPEPVVPEAPPWWKQGWVLEWIAICIAIALGVIGILT